MTEKKKFPYDIPAGAVMDYTDGRFIIAIKDDTWNSEQLELICSEPFVVHICATNGILPFIIEGGPIDSSDVYFNIQECDAKDEILSRTDMPDIEVVLVDNDNNICWEKRHTLSTSQWTLLKSELEKQNAIEFMPGEYDVNVEGLMSAYQPFELLKFARCAIKI